MSFISLIFERYIRRLEAYTRRPYHSSLIIIKGMRMRVINPIYAIISSTMFIFFPDKFLIYYTNRFGNIFSDSLSQMYKDNSFIEKIIVDPKTLKKSFFLTWFLIITLMILILGEDSNSSTIFLIFIYLAGLSEGVPILSFFLETPIVRSYVKGVFFQGIFWILITLYYLNMKVFFRNIISDKAKSVYASYYMFSVMLPIMMYDFLFMPLVGETMRMDASGWGAHATGNISDEYANFLFACVILISLFALYILIIHPTSLLWRIHKTNILVNLTCSLFFLLGIPLSCFLFINLTEILIVLVDYSVLFWCQSFEDFCPIDGYF